MSFLIKIPKKLFSDILVGESLNKIANNVKSDIIHCFFDNTPGGEFKKIENDFFVGSFIGDFIIPREFRNDINGYLEDYCNNFTIEKLRQSRGNFYFVLFNKKTQEIQVYNSMMGILPVYYYISEDAFYISSRMDFILRSCSDNFKINKKYIVEHLLFGYGFRDSTLYENIKLLSTNHFLKIKEGNLNELSHTKISDYYVSEPILWKDSRDKLSDLFIERAKDYLPEEPYYNSLTGGLDGRTLLALGLAEGKSIKTYSYGSNDDKDVKIPQSISKKLGIPYEPIILDKKYAEQHFFSDAQKSGYLTEGNLRFTRSTYYYFSNLLSKKTKYLISGNFGSELMRTMRMHGNLASHIAFDLFSDISDKELSNRIYNSPKFKFINKNYFVNEIKELTDECIMYRRSFNEKYTFNQKFYAFVLEEIFRKYFGAEIILENHFLINRTPFLDFPFMVELFKTELAGCNAEFKVSNPFERFKGQALYPYIIKKTYPKLLKYKLDREYSPGDFLTKWGNLKIAFGYFKRQYFIDQNRYKQPSYSELTFSHNLNKLKDINLDYSFIKKNELNQLFKYGKWKEDYVNFNIHVSFFDYINYVLTNFENVEIQY